MTETKKRSPLKRLFSAVTAIGSAIAMLPALPNLSAAAVTEYDLWICGKHVTNMNCENILGAYECSYNDATKTLTINKDLIYTISSEYYYGTSVISSSIKDLTINVTKDVRLDYKKEDSEPCMDLKDDTTITGKGSLSAGAVLDSAIRIDGTLTVLDTRLSAGCASLVGNAIQGVGSYSIVKIIHSDVSLYGGYSALSNIVIDEEDSVCTNTRYDNVSGRVVSLTYRKLDQYDLTVCDTQVTSLNASDILGNGNFSYDDQTKTLTVKGDATYSDKPIIVNKIDDLTIDVVSDATFTYQNTYAGIYSVDGDLKITGNGTLTISGANSSIRTYNADLTIQNAKLDLGFGAAYSLYGGDTNEKLIIDNSYVQTHSTYSISRFQNMTLQNCYLSSPAGGRYDTSKRKFLTKDGSQRCQITIKPGSPTFYDLVVGGVYVTSDNKNDILGDGNCSYAPSTNTLTLNGDYAYTKANGNVYFVSNDIPDLTVNVNSDMNITGVYCGIYSDCADCTITGNGKLTIKATAAAIDTPYSTLTIRNANLDLQGSYGLSGSPEDSELIMIKSNIYAWGTEAAISGYEYGISFDECAVVSPKNTYYEDDYLYDGYGNIVTSVTIEPTMIKTYNLKVAGVQVTDTNASDILGDGKFSYVPSSNTLILRGNYYNMSKTTFIDNEINLLKIEVASDSLIECGGSCICSNGANLTIKGSGKLTLDTTKGNAANAVYLSGSRLTIEGINMDIKSRIGVFGDGNGEKLIVNNSNLHITGRTAAIDGLSDGIAMLNCYISSPKDTTWDSNNDILYNADGTVVTDVTFKPGTVTNYLLRVGGTWVNSVNASDILENGRFSYDATTNTLTISGDYSYDGTDTFINNNINDLTIYIASDLMINTPRATFVSTFDFDMTITGPGKLMLNVGHNGIDSTGGLLTFKDANITVKSDDRYCYAISGMPNVEPGAALRIINSTIHSEGGNGAVCDFENGIELQECIIASPEGAKIENGTIREAYGSKATVVDIVPLEKYDLYVAGTQVSNENASDILGDGKFSFDENTNTLTINGNCTIDSSSISFIKNNIDNLIVKVASDSDIHLAGITSIQSTANMTITGPGKLTTNGHILIRKAELTIRDANIDVRSVFGIRSGVHDDPLVIINSRIHAEGEYGAICLFGGIELQDCIIASPEGGKNESGAILNADGTTAHVVDIVPLSALAITKQPENASGCIGDQVQFTVEAEGTGLIYQWQYYNTSTKKWENTGLAGNKTATLTVTVTAGRNNMKYHCIVKDASGEKLVSSAATLTVNPKIVTQPVDTSGCIGDKVQFTVEATGVGLIYQWQYYNTSTKKWENTGLTGNKTATLTVTVTAGRNNMKYHCIVKDANGTKLTSTAATLKVNPKIVTQPVDASGCIGDKVQFTVEATGVGLIYQWQYYNTSTKKWENTGLTGNQSPTLTVTVTAGRNNMSYHCIVKDANGTKLTSTPAKLIVNPKIVTQPVDASGCIGDKVQFTVEATGVGLIYQWQYYNTSTKKWENTGLTGNQSPTLTVTVTSARNGMKYHCIVKDANGTKLTSTAATLNVLPKIVIQPQSVSAAAGSTAKFTVEATGIGLTYQWQYYNTSTKKWENTGLAGNKTAELSVTAISSRNGMKYHCIVKDSAGNKLTSTAATLTVK